MSLSQLQEATYKHDLSCQAFSYEHGSSIQKKVGTELIAQLDIEKGATILDLGCGTGYLTKVLSERVGPEGKVVAVDPDGERLKIARENHSASNITYIQADDQTFPPGQYDLIFCNIVIHWIKDKESLLKRVYETLHSQGSFVFTTSDGIYPVPEIGVKVFDLLIRPGFLQQTLQMKMSFLTESQYRSLAFKTGFKNISMTTMPEYLTWRHLDDYIDSMHGWFQGEFDPSQFDQEALQEIKREYGVGPVIQSKPIKTIYAILKK